MFTSSKLRQGEIYTRDQLKQMFTINDQTLYTGIFRPKDCDSIWLFITERKSGGMTEYHDMLKGDTLRWEGQTSGRKDEIFISHERKGLELLVFYRTTKTEYPGAGFRYEGRFRYVSHMGAEPTRFTLQRVMD